MKEKTLYDIFQTALKEEEKAQELYRFGATLAGKETQLRAMFEELADAERGHQETLLQQYAAFKAKLNEEP